MSRVSLIGDRTGRNERIHGAQGLRLRKPRTFDKGPFVERPALKYAKDTIKVRRAGGEVTAIEAGLGRGGSQGTLV